LVLKLEKIKWFCNAWSTGESLGNTRFALAVFFGLAAAPVSVFALVAALGLATAFSDGFAGVFIRGLEMQIKS
jgi:hypothetical protein